MVFNAQVADSVMRERGSSESKTKHEADKRPSLVG